MAGYIQTGGCKADFQRWGNVGVKTLLRVDGNEEQSEHQLPLFCKRGKSDIVALTMPGS